jgi:clorobiocin biosynthesis protein CloN7
MCLARGIANSSREDTTEDVTPAQQAEDVHRLLSALGGGPADVFGSSGGAVVGLALVTAHPDQLRTLVAHEPPLVELLADAARLRAEIQNIYDTYRYRPDIEALRAASTRIVVAAGATSKRAAPQPHCGGPGRPARDDRVDFPGDHGGFMAFPEQFGRVLDQVLTGGT